MSRFSFIKNKTKKANQGKVFESDATPVTEKDIKQFQHDVSHLEFDPHLLTSKLVEFGKMLTGMTLYEYQEEIVYRIIYSVITIEGAELSVLISRQSGKSEAVAFVIDTLAVIMPALAQIFPNDLAQYKDGIKIGLFAPQSDQVETTYSRAMMRLSTQTAMQVMGDPDLKVDLESEAYLDLSNGSFLVGQIASKLSKIESKTYDLIIVEEGQDVDSLIMEKSITPMGSSTNATIVKVGTTGIVKNHFWFTIQDNIRQNRKVKDDRLKYHFEADYKRVIAAKRAQFNKDAKRYHLNYETFVMNQKRKLGDDSDAFRLSYALIWALDSGMFITDKDWEHICNKKLGFPKDIDPDYINAAGLDIGKDKNSTVLTIVQVIPQTDNFDLESIPAKRIIHWLEIHGEDYEFQHNLIMETLIDWEVKILCADYTGVGKPVVDRLTHACGDEVEVIPYTFTRPSKSDMYQALLGDVKSKRIIVPSNKMARLTPEYKKFEEQMKSLQKYYEGSYLVCEKMEGDEYHDDYCDSIALAGLAANHQLPEEIEDEDNPLYNELSSLRELTKHASW